MHTIKEKLEEFDSKFTEYGNGLLLNTAKAPLIKKFIWECDSSLIAEIKEWADRNEFDTDDTNGYVIYTKDLIDFLNTKSKKI